MELIGMRYWGVNSCSCVAISGPVCSFVIADKPVSMLRLIRNKTYFLKKKKSVVLFIRLNPLWIFLRIRVIGSQWQT